MGILTVLASVAWGGMTGLVEDYRLHSAAQILMGTATTARAVAMTRNARIQLRAHPDGDHLAASGLDRPEVWTPLPRDVRVMATPRTPITFHSRGIAAPAGTWVLENRSGRVRVVVSPSGRVRWERD